MAETENKVPQERFNEVIAEKNQLKEQLADMQAKLNEFTEAQKTAEQKKLAEAGEYKQVIEQLKSELETVKPLAEEYTSYQQTKKEQLVSKLPENMRKFTGKLSLAELEEFVAASVTDAGAGAGAEPPKGSRPGTTTDKAKKFDWKTAAPEERAAFMVAKAKERS